MEQAMMTSSAHSGRESLLKPFLIAAAATVLIGWIWLTPPGVLGKADAIGYAVCHRIAVRTYFFGDRQFPLCARCSGMYLGALGALLYHLRERGRGGMPTLKINIVLGLFLVLFGIDGINSYLHFFPSLPNLYQPQNWLRLLTGTALGFGIAAMLVPVIRQTLWTDWQPSPALHSWRQLGELVLIGVLIDAAMLTLNPLILFPLALLSTATILLILTLVYTIVWVMIAKRENSYTSWRAAWMPLLAGFTTALLQIAVMDAARFALTGTWEGFNLLVG
jgi:uncharacterized membrane protein